MSIQMGKNAIEVDKTQLSHIHQYREDQRQIDFHFKEGQKYSLIFANIFLKSQFMELLNFAHESKRRLRMRLLTWNQARTS